MLEVANRIYKDRFEKFVRLNYSLAYNLGQEMNKKEELDPNLQKKLYNFVQEAL